jgi:predicted nuclease of restriction endonuclease-like (RecB) superfamily
MDGQNSKLKIAVLFCTLPAVSGMVVAFGMQNLGWGGLMTGKRKEDLQKHSVGTSGGDVLFLDIAGIIERRKTNAVNTANAETVLMLWEVGRHINLALLDNKRAEYGKHIVATLSRQLIERYGATFNLSGLKRMRKFADLVGEHEIGATPWHLLSWSHIRELLPLRNAEARKFYVAETASRNLGVRDLRRLIERRTYERADAASLQLSESTVPFNTFKDPYLLDILGLKGIYSEGDLEDAIIRQVEAFILEFGHGFTFAERQKRIQWKDTDYFIDLLFYHRPSRRLVAVELKLGKFKPQYKGQMEFYLKWLRQNEQLPEENEPVGLILCAESDREQISLMELDKSGIAVMEYWTELPPKSEFQKRIKAIAIEAREVFARRKTISEPTVHRRIKPFTTPDPEEEDE